MRHASRDCRTPRTPTSARNIAHITPADPIHAAPPIANPMPNTVAINVDSATERCWLAATITIVVVFM